MIFDWLFKGLGKKKTNVRVDNVAINPRHPELGVYFSMKSDSGREYVIYLTDAQASGMAHDILNALGEDVVPVDSACFEEGAD